MAGGRPTSFKPEYVVIVGVLCELGATDVHIAKALQINRATVNRWKKTHPEFCNALKNAKSTVDADVEDSLLKQAMQGNVTAIIFWLKNRQQIRWRDRREVAIDTVDSPFNLFITGDKDDGDTT